MRSAIITTSFFLIVFLLVGCGGGGGDFLITESGNSPPTANAGADKSVKSGSVVALAGFGFDADGDLLTYSWSLTAIPLGSTANLSAVDIANPSFTADLDGTYVLSLVVNDGTATSQADTVTITAATLNSTPTADAGVDQNVVTGTLVTLTGGGFDADANLLSYAWTFTSMPSGSMASLSAADVVKPSFTADLDGTYVLSLVVNDGTATSQADTVTVTAATLNSTPTADAGVDQNVVTGTLVTLTGGGFDADANLLSYAWTFTSMPSGSTANLSAVDIANPSFTADLDGTYVLSLMVNDGTATSQADTVTVTATTINSTPTADAGANQSTFVGRLVNLDGSGSSDADRDPLTYSWSFVTVPLGSVLDNADLSSTSAQAPTFTPDVKGDYVLQLIVNDGFANSAADNIAVSVVRWVHPVSLSDNISPDGQIAYDPQVAIDASGNAVVVWYQSDGISYQIYLSERDGATGIWTHPVDLSDNISPDGYNATDPQVAMDASGNAVIVWHQTDGNTEKIFLSERDGGTGIWSHPADYSDSINPNSRFAYNPKVVMNASGNAIIVWSQTDNNFDGQIFLSERDGATGAWTHPADLSDNVSSDFQHAFIPQVAMDASGNAIVVWCQYGAMSNHILLIEKNGTTGTWSDPTDISDIINPNVSNANEPRVAMDDNGNALVVWIQSDGRYRKVFLSERNGSTGVWTHPEDLSDNISPGQQSASSPQVAMDASSNALVAWTQSDGSRDYHIYLSERDGATGTWTHPVDLSDKISPSGESASSPQVAISDNGSAAVVWDQGAYSSVFLSERDGTTGIWTHPRFHSQNISPQGSAAKTPFVVMNASGFAIIIWIQWDLYDGQVFLSETP